MIFFLRSCGTHAKKLLKTQEDIAFEKVSRSHPTCPEALIIAQDQTRNLPTHLDRILKGFRLPPKVRILSAVSRLKNLQEIAHTSGGMIQLSTLSKDTTVFYSGIFSQLTRGGCGSLFNGDTQQGAQGPRLPLPCMIAEKENESPSSS